MFLKNYTPITLFTLYIFRVFVVVVVVACVIVETNSHTVDETGLKLIGLSLLNAGITCVNHRFLTVVSNQEF